MKTKKFSVKFLIILVTVFTFQLASTASAMESNGRPPSRCQQLTNGARNLAYGTYRMGRSVAIYCSLLAVSTLNRAFQGMNEDPSAIMDPMSSVHEAVAQTALETGMSVAEPLARNTSQLIRRASNRLVRSLSSRSIPSDVNSNAQSESLSPINENSSSSNVGH